MLTAVIEDERKEARRAPPPSTDADAFLGDHNEAHSEAKAI